MADGEPAPPLVAGEANSSEAEFRSLATDPIRDEEADTGLHEETEGPGGEPIAALANSTAVQSVYADNAIVGSVVYGSVHIGGADIPVAALDRTHYIRGIRDVFVSPTNFNQLVEKLLKPRSVMLLSGPRGSGKRTLAGVMLAECGHEPILELAGDLSVEALTAAVRRLAATQPKAGIIVDAIDDRTQRIEVRSGELLVQEILQHTGMRLVITAGRHNVTTEPLHDILPHATVTAPDPKLVAELLLADDKERIASLVTEVLELLPPLVEPSTVRQIIERCRVQPTIGAADLVDDLLGRRTQALLSDWFSNPRTARETALLTAAATCSGAPIHLVEYAARRLAATLSTSSSLATPELGRTFTTRVDLLPPGLATTQFAAVSHHFGVNNEKLLTVAEPHSWDTILRFLWHDLDYDFQECCVEWLAELVLHPNRAVALGAALAAGLLFIESPARIEAELLRPWAHSGRREGRLAAATALGVPTLLGADSAQARSLAYYWSTGGNRSARLTAILVYGGPLGAWDPASSAAAHLWRIGSRSPELRPATDLRLGGLVAAGAQARRVRATVITMVAAQAQARQSSERAYAVLPRIFGALMCGSPAAAESLLALQDDVETASHDKLAEILLGALTTSIGEHYGRLCLRILLTAAAVGDLTENDLTSLIRMLRRKTTGRAQYERLGVVLKQEFARAARADSVSRRTAERVGTTFFGARSNT